MTNLLLGGGSLNKKSSAFKITTIAVAALFIVGGFFVANSAFAAIYSVNPACTDTTPADGVCDDPTTFRTIQEAITAAINPGAVINVMAGTYAENLTINQSLSLVGVGDTTHIIGGIDANGDDVTIQDLKITNSNSETFYYGVKASANNALTLENVTIDVLYYGVRMRSNDSSTSAVITINNSRIKGYAAIYLNGANDANAVVQTDTIVNIDNSDLTGTTSYDNSGSNDFAVIATANTSGVHINFTDASGTSSVANEFTGGAQAKEDLILFYNSDAVVVTGTPTYTNAANSTANAVELFESAYGPYTNTVEGQVVARYVQNTTEFEAALASGATTPIVVGRGDAAITTTAGTKTLNAGTTLLIEANNTPTTISAGTTLVNNGTIIVEKGATFINSGTISGTGTIELCVNTIGTHGCFSSIQSAVTAAPSGAIINVAAGTYNESQILIDKPLTLQGVASSTTIIDGGGTSTGGLVKITASSGTVTISGFTIQNTNNSDDLGHGINVDNGGVSGTDVKILNNAIKNVGPVGIRVNDANSVQIEGNTISSLYSSTAVIPNGIQVGWPNGSGVTGTIKNNTISDCSWVDYAGDYENSAATSAGILIMDTAAVLEISNNVIHNNNVGIDIEAGALTTIENNDIYDNAYGVVLWNQNPSINNNKIENNSTSGVFRTTLGSLLGTVDATQNYWGSVSPNFGAIISGTVNHDPWYIDAGKTILSSAIDAIFDGVASTLNGQGVVSNIGDVTASNFTSFPNLYFEKRTDVNNSATALGRITFSSALDLSSNETTTFLQALGNKMEQSNGRIKFDAQTSAVFAATGATLVMYGLPPGLTPGKLIVRDDAGAILNTSDVVPGGFSQNQNGDVTFDAAHFTQFDIDTTAPVIAAHTDVGPIEATTATGATVTYTAPNATDNIDPTAPAICSAASGTAFVIGDTTVTCNKSDTAGNTATATHFVVHVVDTTSLAPASLAVGSPTLTTLALSWTNNELNGSHYTIKRSLNPINDGNFAAATTLGGAPAVASGVQGYTANNLSSGTLYYFAIKMTDVVPNVSDISTASGTTSSADVPPPTDDTAPSAIANLSSSAGTPPTSEIVLNWSATGDDGSTGMATGYIVKRSTSAITSDNFSAATTVFNSLLPKSNGSAETLTVSGLTSGTEYCFAIKVQDEVPNTSAISNSECRTTSSNLPTVTNVSPITGQNDGNVDITVTGTNFATGTTTVRLTNSDNTFDLSGTYVSATSVTATVGVGMPVGVYGIRVIDDNGASEVFAASYTITNAPDPLPSVTDVVPSNIGTNDSGVNVEIYGTGFTNATGAVVDNGGGTTLTNFTVVSSTKITATIPGTLPAGTYNVKITNAAGTNTVSAVQITVTAPVVIDSGTTQDQVTDNPIDMGNTSTIPVQITMNSNTDDSTLDNNTTIEVVIPPATDVTDADGNAYTGNINPPQLVKPTEEIAAEAGADAVVITMGNPEERINFSNDFVVTVTLESTNSSAPLIWYYNPSTGLEIAGKTGTKDGVDYIPGGTVLNTVNNGGTYTYTIGLLLDHMSDYVAGVTPTISGISPSSGDAGSSVVITGTNFSPGVVVRFGSNTVTVTASSLTQITVTAPSGPGAYNITVINTDALSAISPSNFTVNGGGGSGGGGGGSATPVIFPGVVLGTTAHGNGTLIASNGTIYLVSNGTKRGFRDAAEYLSYGFNFLSVETASSSDMALPEGSILKAMDGTLALDTTDGRTVYVIGNNGVKRGFVSEAVFRQLGYSFSQAMRINLADYTVGSPVDSTSVHPDGTLVISGQTIWWINNGQKHGFTSMDEFNSYGWTMNKVLKANSADLSLPEGSTMQMRADALATGGWLA